MIIACELLMISVYIVEHDVFGLEICNQNSICPLLLHTLCSIFNYAQSTHINIVSMVCNYCSCAFKGQQLFAGIFPIRYQSSYTPKTARSNTFIFKLRSTYEYSGVQINKNIISTTYCPKTVL